jgi:hypothetical protein
MPKEAAAVTLDVTKFDRTEIDGIVTLKYTDEEAFVSTTDVDEATLKKVFNHISDYTEACTTAAANAAKTEMENNPSVNRVIAEFPYTTSKRGGASVTVDRSHTYPGIGDAPDVTKSTIRVAITDPYAKVGKTFIKGLEAELTAALLK